MIYFTDRFRMQFLPSNAKFSLRECDDGDVIKIDRNNSVVFLRKELSIGLSVKNNVSHLPKKFKHGDIIYSAVIESSNLKDDDNEYIKEIVIKWFQIIILNEGETLCI